MTVVTELQQAQAQASIAALALIFGASEGSLENVEAIAGSLAEFQGAREVILETKKTMDTLADAAGGRNQITPQN